MLDGYSQLTFMTICEVGFHPEGNCQGGVAGQTLPGAGDAGFWHCLVWRNAALFYPTTIDDADMSASGIPVKIVTGNAGALRGTDPDP